MQTYIKNGKPISRKEFISKLSPENKNFEMKKDNIQKTKNIVIGSLFVASVGTAIYGYNKMQQSTTPEESKKAKYYFLGGNAAMFLLAFIFMKNNNL